jgi:hypothetical protein
MSKFGTSSSPESLTLTFWVKSNKTGTYSVEIKDKDTLVVMFHCLYNYLQRTLGKRKQ